MTAQHSTAQHSTAHLCAVIPSIPQDIDKLLRNTEYFFRYLPITKIYVIGPADIAESLRQAHDNRLLFLNENELVDVPRVRELYSSRTDNGLGRAGWYIQQFIKMQFARFTKDEYYLIWDSDTIPVRHIDFFDNNSTPILDLRLQQIPSYYKTMTKLLPYIAAPYHKSFVTEHMLVNSQHMRECLSDIEANSLIAGSSFQEKVINAVDIDDLPFMGFSEYETYGNYVVSRHPDSYVMRDWRSLRTGIRFYGEVISDEQAAWLAEVYYAVSVEKWQRGSVFRYLAKSRLFRKMFSPVILERIVIPLRAVRRVIRWLIPSKKKGA